MVGFRMNVLGPGQGGWPLRVFLPFKLPRLSQWLPISISIGKGTAQKGDQRRFALHRSDFHTIVKELSTVSRDIIILVKLETARSRSRFPAGKNWPNSLLF